jgi:hypothetical protein
VPYGFICGWPTQGGDLYGGNMYVSSAADAAGLQARASAAAVLRWGSGDPGVIAHSVCKGKYQPWKGGARQYGCFRHHALREKKILKHGVREGWASFEQWPKPPNAASVDGKAAGGKQAAAQPKPGSNAAAKRAGSGGGSKGEAKKRRR